MPKGASTYPTVSRRHAAPTQAGTRSPRPARPAAASTGAACCRPQLCVEGREHPAREAAWTELQCGIAPGGSSYPFDTHTQPQPSQQQQATTAKMDSNTFKIQRRNSLHQEVDGLWCVRAFAARLCVVPVMHAGWYAGPARRDRGSTARLLWRTKPTKQINPQGRPREGGGPVCGAPHQAQRVQHAPPRAGRGQGGRAPQGACAQFC